jgi:hypothetical protein
MLDLSILEQQSSQAIVIEPSQMTSAQTVRRWLQKADSNPSSPSQDPER